MPARDGYGGRKAQAWVAAVHRTYGLVCHLCHHGDSDSADHLRPRAERPELMYVVSNGRPVHHKACPSCGRTCNTSRGTKALAVAPERDELSFFDRPP